MLLVKLTQRHIDKGLSQSYTLDCLNLAIREAIKEQFGVGHSFQILIFSRDLAFIDGWGFWLPPICQKIIENSDTAKPVQPCEFELDISEELFDSDSGRQPQQA